ncbi:hypothetical protein [Brachyspira hampsonii]|nr:hypothetical protein [Brachyspira hampsonii]
MFIAFIIICSVLCSSLPLNVKLTLSFLEVNMNTNIILEDGGYGSKSTEV